MNTNIKLNDIADELLILNKYTIENLFKLPKCADCVALYIFYYKTAKWQKTNTIKANDKYIKMCLGWGSKKLQDTKKILKENGLIDIVQRHKNGRVSGWYVQVSYLVSKKAKNEIKIVVEQEQPQEECDLNNNTHFQQVENTTSCFQATNALKEKNIYLKNNKLNAYKLNNNKSEAQAPAQAPDTYIIDLPTNKFNTQNENYYVTVDFYNTMKELYPSVSVINELRSMKAWLITNTKKRKTLQGMEKFINSWLSRQQNNNNTYSQRNNNYSKQPEQSSNIFLDIAREEGIL